MTHRDRKATLSDALTVGDVVVDRRGREHRIQSIGPAFYASHLMVHFTDGLQMMIRPGRPLNQGTWFRGGEILV